MEKIICIVGPTASGKTALGIALSKKLNGEVVSADSRMVYKGMEIGTAVPRGIPNILHTQYPILEVEGVPHYLIGIVEPHQPFTVVDWRQRAQAAIADIHARGKLPIVVGGTGLYIQALVDQFDIPPAAADKEIRAKLERELNKERASGMIDHQSRIVRRLLALDPDAKELVDLENPRRVIRALEVCLTTGKPFTTQRKKGAPTYDALQIGLRVQKEEWEERIRIRLEEQLRNGLIEEVRRLNKQYGCDIPPMQGFIYKELCQVLDGSCSLDQAKELIVVRTCQYAKRQRQWFARDKRIQWIDSPRSCIVDNSPRFSSDNVV